MNVVGTLVDCCPTHVHRVALQSVSPKGADGAVTISTVQCLPGTDLPCAPQKARVNLTLTPAPTSVRMTLSVSGAMDAGVKAWTAPVGVNITYTEAAKLKVWAPWDRGTRDALAPSDGGYSWWHGDCT